MSDAQIFISYRRDDTAGYARAVYDALSRRFGQQRVFIDVDDIAAGQAFDTAIAQAVGHSQVLLVLIGPRWLAAPEGGAPRLHAADDFVRQEVAAGLAGGMRVIPLLFDGAAMPAASQLPEALQPLARRQAMEMDAARFGADTDRLVAVLCEALGEPTVVAAAAPAGADRSAAPGRRRLALGLGAGVVVAVAALLAWRGLPGGDQRAEINGRWQAEVVYDWPNARHAERFEFAGEGAALRGSASFLRLDRAVVEGRVDAEGLSFVTRSDEQLGDRPSRETRHHYRGRLVGDELHFTMQTEGGYSVHRPVEFVARRSPR